MHPTDQKIFTKLIRLMRKKRKAAGVPESASVVEMIDPVIGLPRFRKSGDAKAQESASGSAEGEAKAKAKAKAKAYKAAGESGAPSMRSRRGRGKIADGPSGDQGAKTSEGTANMLRTVSSNDGNDVPIAHAEEPPVNPGFNIFANARLWRRDQGNLNYSGEVAKLYRDAFTPTRPKRSYKDFSGRRETIETIIQAVEEEKSHVILLGEKGMGKTSLANVVVECAKEAGYLVARVVGSADLTFEHLIRSILEQFSDRIAQAPVGDILQRRLGAEDLTELLNGGTPDVPAAIRIFEQLADNQAIVLIDDFERIEDTELKIKIAELMEVLSDQGAWLSFLIFGRASRATDILPKSFDSLPNITWVKLQSMRQEETDHIIRRGASAVGIRFNEDVVESLVRLSQGVPSATQWLCLLAVRRATQRYAAEVELPDLAAIVHAAANKVDPKLSAHYDSLCTSNRKGWADDILYLAVQTPTDSNGVFSTDEMSRISFDAIGRSVLELPLHSALSRLANDNCDAVLQKVGTANGTCYRFANPTMRTIVMLKNANRIPNMRNALLEKVDDVEYLPSPGVA